MVRRIFLAFLALVICQASFAGTPFPQPAETKPTDVPAFNYVAPLLTTNGAVNTPIDPNVTPPPFTGLTEVNPNTVTTGMIGAFTAGGATFTGSVAANILTVNSMTSGTVKAGDVLYGTGVTGGTGVTIAAFGTGGTSGAGSTGTYQIAVNEGTIPLESMGTTNTSFCLTNASGGPCIQAKMRTISNVTRVLFDDPIRNFCSPGTSHLHEFFGNLQTNACSTYPSLRNKCMAHSAGSCVNGTGYWFPAPIKTNPFSDGFDYAVKANSVVVYYIQNTPSLGATTAKLTRGLRYVFGRNMDDPDNSQLQQYLNTFNNTIGHQRYLVSNGTGNFDSQGFYTCVGATPNSSNVLKNADGSDPFNGTCTAGADLYINLAGSACWDGTNPWSPGGYSNNVKTVYDSDQHGNVCPYNYYRIPQLVQEIHFAQQGFSDYGAWRLSSDNPMQSKLDGFPICATDFSNAPCANGATLTASISGTTLTVSAVTGANTIGQPTIVSGVHGYKISGTGITGTPIITGQVSGTAGGTGTYTINVNEGTVASETIRASEYVENGLSIHEDWEMAWDYTTMNTWMVNCVGTLNGNTPHECNTSQIDGTHYMIGGNSGEALTDGYIIVNDHTLFPTTSAANMFKVPTQSNGPMTMPTNTH